ncbi:hypothetical protein PFISCL1PPCAC_23935, partial [Pristionchus fissidentatus]
VLYYLDKKLNIHQVDKRAIEYPTCKSLSVPLKFEDVTACAFTENYIAFATSCKDETTGDAAGSGNESDDDVSRHDERSPIWVFDMRNMEQVLVETDAHSDVVSSLAFKGDLLISGGVDGLVNVIDIKAPEDEYVQATIPVDSAVDRVGVFSIKNTNMFYATTEDSRWNLLRMNGPEDVDNVIKRRVRKERMLVDMVGLPRDDFPIATIEYCVEDSRMHLIGSSLDGTRSSIIGEYDFHKELPRVAKFCEGTLFTGGEDGYIAGFQVDLRDGDGKTMKDRFKSRANPY